MMEQVTYEGEFNELQVLILKENSLAYYVHCFVHQLQLTLVIVAKNHVQITLLFNIVFSLLNMVRALCKMQDVTYNLMKLFKH